MKPSWCLVTAVAFCLRGCGTRGHFRTDGSLVSDNAFDGISAETLPVAASPSDVVKDIPSSRRMIYTATALLTGRIVRVFRRKQVAQPAA